MLDLTAADILPTDGADACLVGRLWVSGPQPGPRTVAVRDGNLIDLSRLAPTLSDLFDLADAAAKVRAHDGAVLATVDAALAEKHLLAPCDLQAIKAAGVTFADSLVERVIEERANGDFMAAQRLRMELAESFGGALTGIKPGTPEAEEAAKVLKRDGMWSQYLEVGIGPDAEIFTKAQPMSAVGCGAEVGLHPKSEWNNPEPEVVLAVNSRGEVKGAALGNDVNLRDFEGRSALLLGKAKDNNASCAIGPFIRLFDDHFGIDDVRRCELAMQVTGPEGFIMKGESSLSKISRDPLDLVSQAIGANHQYPDGFMLFMGTMFAPTQDRHGPGQGFTHVVGDVVTVQTPSLGTLVNRVNTSDKVAPWTFGTRALMRNLAARGLVQ